jgi:hypothetical protein
MDIANNFQFWRFHHMKTVERIIGHKTGTGGSSGVEFLKKALDIEFFPTDRTLGVANQSRARHQAFHDGVELLEFLG